MIAVGSQIGELSTSSSTEASRLKVRYAVLVIGITIVVLYASPIVGGVVTFANQETVGILNEEGSRSAVEFACASSVLIIVQVLVLSGRERS